MQSVKLQVIGKVQGVSFRMSTLEKARSLNISGWVKNEPDGSVVIYAQGSSRSMSIFIEWCHQGPTFAKVQKVLIENVNLNTTDQLINFEIKR